MGSEELTEQFIDNVEYLKQNGKQLHFRDRKYIASIIEQLRYKPAGEFSRLQQNIINGIARKLKLKRPLTKKAKAQKKYVIKIGRFGASGK